MPKYNLVNAYKMFWFCNRSHSEVVLLIKKNQNMTEFWIFKLNTSDKYPFSINGYIIIIIIIIIMNYQK